MDSKKEKKKHVKKNMFSTTFGSGSLSTVKIANLVDRSATYVFYFYPKVD